MATPAFFAVLRDISKLAASAADDLASQSAKMAAAADDIAALTGKAAIKTAGVAGDDLAVGAGQVSGVSPHRELPALWRISKGSLLNKVWLSALLLLVSYIFPLGITIALVLGALYLAYEGGEGLMELLKGEAEAQTDEPVLTEDEKVKGAVKTDMVLSFEMLVISLAAAGDVSLEYKVAVLALVGLLMTVVVYGVIALIIRLDDMGLALARSSKPMNQKLGRALVNAAPLVLRVLGPIGMVAMFAVAGGILMHTLAHIEYPHWALGLGFDILVGVVTGMAMALTHNAWLKMRGAAH